MMETGKQPNLIYVFADQLSLNRLGFGGDRNAKTPFLDAFSKECLSLTNACSGHPLGGPYRASLFTGQYSTSTGMVINALRMHPGHRFFAQILHENGWRTGFIGKWNLYSAKLGKGHTVKNSYIPEGPYRFGFSDYFAAYDYHHTYFAPGAFYHLNSEEKRFAHGFEPDHQTDLAIAEVRKNAETGTPFALFLSYGTPHGPWTRENVRAEDYELFSDVSFPLPDNYLAKNDPHADVWARLNKKERASLPERMRCYYAMTANLDRNLSRLYGAVEAAGIAQNTLFVFTSDHGELFGAHGRGGKNIFYDEAVRVPFLMKFGDRLPSGENKTPFGTVDVMPTVLSLLGVADHGEAQGADYSEALTKGKEADAACLLMGTGPNAVWGNGREWRAVRTARYTYAAYASGREEFLFDNMEDPLQIKNLAAEEAQQETLAALKARMAEKMTEIGDQFSPNSFYKKNWVKGRILKDTLPRQPEKPKKHE